jgi:Flp pilus assembly protein TadD
MNRIRQIVAVSALCFAIGASPVARHGEQATAQEPAMRGGHVKVAAPAVSPISLSDADGQDLVLEEFSARAAIEGMLSLTELDLRFRNPKGRRIEGRFSCTLPANAAISRFAKEVNGQLMEGEVVERLRANQVYEQFLHQMRDPALLEQDQGNRFSARIFPIEANASVRIVLAYSALLPMQGGVRRYALPMRGMPAIKHFTFRAYVSALPGEDGPGAPKSDVSGLANATHSTADIVSLDESDHTPSKDIELTWRPTAAASSARLLKAGEFYVAAFRPDIAPANQKSASHAWTFYVDTSASSAEGSEHRIRALESLLASLPGSDQVQLIAFDQEIASLGSGSAAELSHSAGSLLRARLFLGGTDLGALFRHIAKNAGGRTIVVASDLVATLGDIDKHGLTDALKTIPSGTNVHALILGSRQDTAMARALVAGRGRIVSIPFNESIDDRAHAAADELRRPLGASFDVVDSAAQWVYPSHFDDVQSGDEIVVLGRKKPAGEPAPRLNGTAIDRSSQSLPAGPFGPLLEREGYRAYLDYLAEREANEPSEAVRNALATEQVKVSIERRVVIPRTTMLVLESEWDYQRFGLDRRALASILTVDTGGIGVIDRRNPNLPPTPMPQRPVAVDKWQFSHPPPPPTTAEAGVPGGVAGGSVANGLADAAPPSVASPGGVSESITVTGAAPQLQISASSEAFRVTAEAPMVDTTSSESVTRVRPDMFALPAPPPAPPRPVASPRALREEKKQNIGWTKPSRPRQEEIDAFWRELDKDPQNRDAYNKLSDALVARAEWGSLRRLALQWQPYDPENPQVYEILGIADEQLGNADEAARAEASLIEIAPGKTELLQRAGLLLLRTHHANLAETPLRRALELRLDRANGYRHLALMLWREGRLEEAASVLESATRQQFPGWYRDVQRVIREELGYVYRAWSAKEPSRQADVERRARDFHVDLARRDALRITLAWETDANDVDLHVVDPRGEECYYQHKSTASGLELYEDITQGLGPEVVRTAKLVKGTYHIGVNYFAAGPMGVSRGIVVVMRGDDFEIYPFRLIEGSNRDMRYLAAVTVK